MAKIGFNPQNAEKREERGCLPAGEYLFMITASDMVAGKKPGSQMLKLTYSCLSEGFKGRLMWQSLNLVNPSAEAQKIANSELRELCEAIGLGNVVVDDSAMLHNKPMLIKIKIKKDDTGQFGDQNAPVSWKPAGSAAAGAPGGFRAPTGAQASTPAFRAPVATPSPAPAPFVQPAQEPAQQSLDTANPGESTTSTTTPPSEDVAAPAEAPAEAPAAAPAAGRPTPPWMAKR